MLIVGENEIGMRTWDDDDDVEEDEEDEKDEAWNVNERKRDDGINIEKKWTSEWVNMAKLALQKLNLANRWMLLISPVPIPAM